MDKIIHDDLRNRCFHCPKTPSQHAANHDKETSCGNLPENVRAAGLSISNNWQLNFR